MDKLLDVQNLNVTYRSGKSGVKAVRNASFSIFEGDALGIVGESGSGKSTMIMAILGLLSPKSTEITGKAEFLGRDLLTISRKELNDIRWRELSVVFQKAMNSLSPVHRIFTQIEDIYRVHEPRASREEIEERMKYLLKLVNLPDRVYHLYPHEMSGGMLQRVAIAMSLLHFPKLVIFDEATTALDVVTQGQVLSEILDMEKTLHMTRIMITHDMSVVASSCSKVAVMYAGHLVEIGLVKSVLTKPKHPYTRGLLNAFPSLMGERKKLASIPGYLPDLSEEQEGCIFAPRCTFATDKCRSKKPVLEEVEDGWSVACWHPGGEE